jgi:hypothetical protein
MYEEKATHNMGSQLICPQAFRPLIKAARTDCKLNPSKYWEDYCRIDESPALTTH